MKFSYVHFLVIIISSLLLVSSLTAQEHLLNYQGRLTEDGAPFDGETDISFTLYDAETGGNELWSEKHSLEVQNGIFNVLLGSLEDFPRNIFSVNDELYLGITVNDGDEMEPRSRITSVVYAARSAVAATVDDGVITGGKLVDDIDIMTSGTIEASTFMGDGSELTGIVADHISPESVGSEELADGAITSDKLADDIDIETSGKIIADIYLINGWIGTEEEESVEVRVNNEPVLKILPEFFQEDFQPTVIMGSSSNQIGENIRSATISGGRSNQVDGNSATVGGGHENFAGDGWSTISGGVENTTDGLGASVGGGVGNLAGASYSTVSGGSQNEAIGSYASVTGGNNNTADASYATVCGGTDNLADSFRSFVGGGRENEATGSNSFIAGGMENSATGGNSFVGSGQGNEANGTDSFAAGRFAKANHDGTFVWADRTFADFESTDTDQFLIKSHNGVGINTNDPNGFDLAVDGNAANQTGQWSVFSDARLKNNIENLELGMLDRLLSLQGYSFEYNNEAIQSRTVQSGTQIGLIAQEVAKVFPEWVDEDKDGFYYVTERGLTAILIEALRELRDEKDEEIEITNKRLNSLEKENQLLMEKLYDMEEKLQIIAGFD